MPRKKKQLPYKITSYSGADSAVCRAINKGNMWEKKIYNIYSQWIKDDDVIVDCGAFLGSHTLAFSDLAPNGKVHAIEPCTIPFTCLRNNVKINNITNICTYNALVTDEDGKCEEIGTNNDGGSSMINLLFKKNHKASFKTVEKKKTMTVDGLKLDRCDLIKIDVERAEWLVLKGSHDTITRHRPKILLETFNRKKNVEKLVQWAREYNYSYENIKGDDWILLPNT